MLVLPARAAAGALVLTLGFAVGVAAQSPAVELSDLSLEELTQAEVVYAAARRPQSLTEAPSAVTIVSAADIRRHGHRTLADVLRSVPGFYVTDDRNYSYVGVRGFGRPGDFNTRLLLQIDGVRLNDDVYDMAPVGADFPLDLDLVERVEVVRGPASSLYGTSAFFAVVNVVTRRGRDVGGEVALERGAYGTWRERAAYGRRLAGGLEVLGAVSRGTSNGRTLYYPEFTSVGSTAGVTTVDDEDVSRLFASASKGPFSFSVLHGTRGKGVPTGAYGTVFGDPGNRTSDARTQLALGYDGSVGGGFEGTARVQYGRYHYEGTYVYGASTNDVLHDETLGSWWGAEVTASRRFARHQLTVGLEYQQARRRGQGTAWGDSPPALTEVPESSQTASVFAQDEIQLGIEGLVAHAGLRFDHGRHDVERVSPRVGLVWTTQEGTLKLLYGEAFRAPNEYEAHYYQHTDPRLHPETIRTFEVVGARSLGSARATVSLFHSRIEGLISLQGSPGALGFSNVEDVHCTGVEAALDATWGGARGRLSYTFQHAVQSEPDVPLSNSPRHLLKAEVFVPLLEERLEAGADLQYVSARRTLADSTVGAYATVNLTVRALRLWHGLELSATVRNLLDADYADPGSEEHAQATIGQDGRNASVQLSWRF